MHVSVLCLPRERGGIFRLASIALVGAGRIAGKRDFLI